MAKQPPYSEAFRAMWGRLHGEEPENAENEQSPRELWKDWQKLEAENAALKSALAKAEVSEALHRKAHDNWKERAEKAEKVVEAARENHALGGCENCDGCCYCDTRLLAASPPTTRRGSRRTTGAVTASRVSK